MHTIFSLRLFPSSLPEMPSYRGWDGAAGHRRARWHKPDLIWDRDKRLVVILAWHYCLKGVYVASFFFLFGGGGALTSSCTSRLYNQAAVSQRGGKAHNCTLSLSHWARSETSCEKCPLLSWLLVSSCLFALAKNKRRGPWTQRKPPPPPPSLLVNSWNVA